MGAATIRFLVLADTHDTAFPDPSKLPRADVVLHCGDLTMIGGLSNYRAAIQSLSRCNAELKLVIPGNHDVSLDPDWWMNNLDEDDDPEEPQKARSLFSADSEHTGVRLLDEGIHKFVLKDGRSFSIYASPYTPEYNGYAFSYGPEEDRFNPRDATNTGIASDKGHNHIPELVDIVVTHGPPLVPEDGYRLDIGGNGDHCGCSKLWTGIQRSRPRLHCFGHIHEGYGAQRVCWTKDSGVKLMDTTIKDDGVLTAGGESDETLLVNAAIMNHHGDRNNNPFVVDLDFGGQRN